MGLIERLFNNPTMQEAAFGKIKAMLREQGHTHVILALKPDDSLDIQMLDSAPVIYSRETAQAIADALQDAEAKIKEQRADNKRVAEMCIESECNIISARNRIADLERYIENAARHGVDVYTLPDITPIINPQTQDNGTGDHPTA